MSSKTASRIAASVIGVLATAVTTGRAQQRDSVPMLSAVVVTATLQPVPLGAVANGVTVLQGEALREAGIAHVLDALRTVPGVTIAQTGSFGGTASLFMRGGESDYVRVLIDGVPANQPGGAIDLAALTTADVDRIEIVRGPTSVLYGSDAMTGVIQIFTRRTRAVTTGSAAWRGGTFGSRDASAHVAGSFGGRGDQGLAFTASQFASDGTYSFNNRYRNTTLGGSLDLVGAQPRLTQARISVRHTDAEYHYPTDGSGVPSDSNQFQTGTTTTVSADIDRSLGRRARASLLLASQAERTRYDDQPDNASDTVGFYGSSGRARVSRRSAGARVDLAAANGRGRDLHLTLGGVVEREAEVSSSAYQSQFGDGGGSTDVSRTNRAVYLQALVDTGSINLTLGARLDDNERFGTFATYRAGLSYRVGPGTRFRASLGTAFKEPTFFETYASGFATGNPDLKPERARSWEVGAEHLLAGRLWLSATWFDQRFRDMIQYTFTTPAPGAPNYYNIAGADASGLETEGRITFGGGLSATARYTWVRTEASDSGFDGASFATGQRLLRRPTHGASLEVDARRSGAAVSMSVQWVGDRSDLDFSAFPAARVKLDPYLRVDLGGQWEVSGRRGGWVPGLALTLRVENLLDASYQEVLGFPARGRTILVGGRLGSGR